MQAVGSELPAQNQPGRIMRVNEKGWDIPGIPNIKKILTSLKFPTSRISNRENLYQELDSGGEIPGVPTAGEHAIIPGMDHI